MYVYLQVEDDHRNLISLLEQDVLGHGPPRRDVLLLLLLLGMQASVGAEVRHQLVHARRHPERGDGREDGEHLVGHVAVLAGRHG